MEKVFIPMTRDNIDKILSGDKTTTTRSERGFKQIGIEIGESKIVKFGNKSFRVINRGLLTIEEAGGKQKLQKSEGFGSNGPMFKQTKDWLDGKGKLYVYDIKENKKTMKIGLDIHGVINDCPKLFSELSKALCSAGWEIHILTGKHITPTLKQQLENWNIRYTHLFSIADFHKQKGTTMWYSDPENPWIDDELWNRTKGDYCEKNKIDLCFDDMDEYFQYFKTPAARFYSNNRKENA